MLHKPTQQEQFQAALDDFGNRIKEAFLLALAHIRSRLVLTRIIVRLERGDVEGAIEAIGANATAFNPVRDAIDAAFGAGGNGANNELPVIRAPDGLPISITFNQRAPAAEAWVEQHGAALVRQITDDQRAMLRQVISRDVGVGMNSRAIALDIVGTISKVTGNREGGVIGLTASQEQWVANYEAALRAGSADAAQRNMVTGAEARIIRRAARSGEPLPEATIGKLVRAYRNRALRYRGELLGRTEAHAALNAGRDEAMRQAIGSGHVSGNLVDQRWMTIMDGRERLSHAEMNGQTVPWGQSFISGLGNRLQYPGDPSAPAEDVVNCRCSKVFVVRKAS